MWDRNELKYRGRQAFHANWIRCIIVEAILGAIVTVQSSSIRSNIQEYRESFPGVSIPFFSMLAIILGSATVLLALSVLANIFIRNPLFVGGHRFYLVNSFDQNTNIKIMISPFTEEGSISTFINIFITMFIKDLFIALGFIFFVIPGIVMQYSYCMVPFILAEDPKIPWRDALARSKNMMQGQKLNAFMLDLSFIGWIILAGITGNVVGVLYTNPYMRATHAELYKVLRQDHSRTVVIDV